MQRIHNELQRPPARTEYPPVNSKLRVRVSPYVVRRIVDALNASQAEPFALPAAGQESGQDADEPSDPDPDLGPETQVIEISGSLIALATGIIGVRIAHQRGTLNAGELNPGERPDSQDGPASQPPD